VSWGKYTRETYPALEDGKLVEKEKVTIPVQIMVNHALVDGRHIAAFFENLDKELKRMTDGEI
jgi:chloramphenicol O-acetyltransferase type A